MATRKNEPSSPWPGRTDLTDADVPETGHEIKTEVEQSAAEIGVASTPRGLAILRTAERIREYPMLSLGMMDTSPLATKDPRDIALARALDHAVARRWLTLEAVLSPLTSRGWDRVETNLRAVLMVGAAQLLFMDRIPAHAAIDRSVTIAKRLVRPKAGGLVNAVLRNVDRMLTGRVETFDATSRSQIPLATGGALTVDRELFPADPIPRLSAQTSHDPDVLARWYAAYGEEEAVRLALHNLVEAPILVAADIEPEHRPDDEQPILIPHDDAGFHVFTAPHESLIPLLRQHPGARVQDPTSAAPVESLRNQPIDPKFIIDACAGKGTKTRQLRTLYPNATIIAADRDRERLSVLKKSFRSDPAITVMSWDDLLANDDIPPADLLVLDVPCSNTGVLARRVEARYRASTASIEELVEIQRQIFVDTFRLRAPDGHVLYATCSIEPQENERQIEWMQTWHSAEPIASSWTRPTGLPGESLTRYRDGGGWALLRFGTS